MGLIKQIVISGKSNIVILTERKNMSELSRNDEEIKRLAKSLYELLNDPYPGLSTWIKFRNRTARELRDALNQKLSPEPLPPGSKNY